VDRIPQHSRGTSVINHLGLRPPVGFKVACFSLNIEGGSAGPTRAVAILPE